MPMRAPSDTVKEMSRKRGETPYRLDNPCALIIGGKRFSSPIKGVSQNNSSPHFLTIRLADGLK